MKPFLADFWRFVLRSPEHPVYQHELNGWSYLKGWRDIRKGCLPAMVLTLLSSAGCCGLVTIGPILEGQSLIENIPLIVFLALIGFLMGAEFIRWITSLLATALTATAISSEVEAETFGLLRLTSIPPRQVVLAKYGAALRQIQVPLITVAVVRILSIIGMVLLGIGLLVYSVAETSALPSTGLEPLLEPSIVLDGATALGISGYVAALLAALAAGLVWLLYWLISPWLSMMLFAAVGMIGSAFARTRSGGLFAAFGVRVVYMMASYIVSQFVATGFSLFSAPLLTGLTLPFWIENLDTIEPSILIFAGSVLAVLWIAALVVGQLAIVWLLLGWASQRAGRLPYSA